MAQQPSNPPSQLSAPPSNGCLPKLDGMHFSAMVQSARLAANAISRKYPDLTASSINDAYNTATGQMKLLHLSAIMYSYWHAAPAGPSVFDLAAQQLTCYLRGPFREQCAAWGSQRLSASIDEFLYIVEDGPDGSLVADHTMTKFYRVLGMKTSPAAALTRQNIKLPIAVRLTALPFRGHLVYDGVVFGCNGSFLSRAKTNILINRSRAAQAAGNVITGFQLQSSNEVAPVQSVDVHNMSVSQLREFVRKSGGSVVGCVEKNDLIKEANTIIERGLLSKAKDDDSKQQKLSREQETHVDRLKRLDKVAGFIVFRRTGYTEATNRGHVVTVMDGVCCLGSFQSKELVPTATEIVEQLLRMMETKGCVPGMVAVDDKNTATAVNLVTERAGIHTGFYPPPSIEEQTFSVLMGGYGP